MLASNGTAETADEVIPWVVCECQRNAALEIRNEITMNSLHEDSEIPEGSYSVIRDSLYIYCTRNPN